MKIAIVEDCLEDQEKLEKMIRKYFRENLPEEPVTINMFSDAVRFLDSYKAAWNIIFMDIQMPMMDGMNAAEKLRRIDENVSLVFVTNMAQYAVQGYNVNALGFVLKPIQYEDFYLSMRRAVQHARMQEGRTLTISGKQGIQRLQTRDILYIEVDRHVLIFHYKEDAFRASGSMQEIQKQLGEDFLLCNRSFLINPQHIEKIIGTDVLLSDGSLVPISRPRKKEFLAAFNHWLSMGNEL